MIHLILDITATSLCSLVFYLAFTSLAFTMPGDPHANQSYWKIIPFPLPCVCWGLSQQDVSACIFSTTITLCPQPICRAVVTEG